MAYTTAKLVQQELRAEKQFSATTNPTIGTVNTWISEASAIIDEQAGSVFASTTYTDEYIDYEGSETILLKHAPVVSVTSVSYNNNPLGSSLGDDWDVKVADTDYSLYENRGELLLLLNNFKPSEGRKRIKVTYVAGYATAPATIQLLATKMVTSRVIESLLNNNVNEGNDGGSVSVGSISIVEPASYGVNSYKQLKSEVDTLMAQVLNGTGVYRYTV